MTVLLWVMVERVMVERVMAERVMLERVGVAGQSWR
jgi:hypothetical protein